MQTISNVDKFCENYAKDKLLHKHLYQINNQKDKKVVHVLGHQDISFNHTSGNKQFVRGTISENVIEMENGERLKTNEGFIREMVKT